MFVDVIRSSYGLHLACHGGSCVCLLQPKSCLVDILSNVSAPQLNFEKLPDQLFQARIMNWTARHITACSACMSALQEALTGKLSQRFTLHVC